VSSDTQQQQPQIQNNMAAVTIRYGMTNEIRRDFDNDESVGDLLNNRSILGALNAPEGCSAVSMGETLDHGSSLGNYTSITLEKQASSKA
tara:strand:- start:7 stop:276 length:270 start_codon:yes stop_codon:yes gene_type:complete